MRALARSAQRTADACTTLLEKTERLLNAESNQTNFECGGLRRVDEGEHRYEVNEIFLSGKSPVCLAKIGNKTVRLSPTPGCLLRVLFDARDGREFQWVSFADIVERSNGLIRPATLNNTLYRLRKTLDEAFPNAGWHFVERDDERGLRFALICPLRANQKVVDPLSYFTREA